MQPATAGAPHKIKETLALLGSGDQTHRSLGISNEEFKEMLEEIEPNGEVESEQNNGRESQDKSQTISESINKMPIFNAGRTAPMSGL